MKEVLKEIDGDLGDISFITLLNFVCIRRFMRQVDAADNEIVRLLVE